MVCCSCIFVWFIIAAIALKIYLKLTSRHNGSYTCLAGKTAIVTGANTGIGYFTALDFAKRGARVILACRNKEKAEEAQRKIIKSSQNLNVVYKLVDFASLESVRAFAKDVNETEGRVDILVNNAAALGFNDEVTKDGLQLLLQTNHISQFLLTHLLIDKIKMSAPSRIVNVSSNTANYAKLNVETINEFPKGGNMFLPEMYPRTKLCNILFTTVLADKLEGTGVTVNTLHPGVIQTELTREFKGILKYLNDTVINFYYKTPEEGAQTTIYVATSDKLTNVTGKLFDNCEEISMYVSAQDPVLANALWKKSEELAKLKPDEKIK